MTLMFASVPKISVEESLPVLPQQVAIDTQVDSQTPSAKNSPAEFSIYPQTMTIRPDTKDKQTEKIEDKPADEIKEVPPVTVPPPIQSSITIVYGSGGGG